MSYRAFDIYEDYADKSRIYGKEVLQQPIDLS